nr:MFS transporter [Roseibium denhamense]
MIGPALSYSVIAVSGFTAAFLIAALLGAVWLFVMLLSIPNGFRAPSKTRKQNTGGPVNWGLLLAGGTCVLFTATNSLFVSAMPLYFVTEVALPEFTPGLSLSIKCAVEIGAIFVSAFLAERFGFKPVLLASAALGIAGMLLFSIASSIWHVAAISALEGLYYGLFAGVAITYVQSFAPNRLGRATATYMNSLFLGGMIGSVSMGFIASSFDFRAVLFVAAACSATALCAVALGGRRHAQN